MAEKNDSKTANAPYQPGELVHICQSAPQDTPELYHHKHACEVVSIYRDYTQFDTDDSDIESLSGYTYILSPVTKDTTLSALYHHKHLRPSPRGYENINKLLGEQPESGPPAWERDFGKLMRKDLRLINTCLSTVDFDEDSLKDWMREIRKGDIDRTNSVFAEMILLYQLRLELGFESVKTNALFGPVDSEKDTDIRVTTTEWDMWIEVYKPDFVDTIPEGGGFISPEATGTAVGNKIRKKFDDAREHLPEDAVIILGVYLVEGIGQGLQLAKWLDQDYFDVGEYCDAFLTFTHLSFPTEFKYYPITPKGEDCGEFIQILFEEHTDSS